MQSAVQEGFSYSMFVFLVLVTGFVVIGAGITLTSPVSALMGGIILMLGIFLCRSFWKTDDAQS